MPAVVTPSSLALMKSFHVPPLFVKSWLRRLYVAAPGLRTQSWIPAIPSGSLTRVVRPVPRARVQLPVPSGFVLIDATSETGCMANVGPTLGVGVGAAVGGAVGVGVGVGFGVAFGVAAGVGVAVARTVAVAVGPGVPVAAATSAQPATGRPEASARTFTLEAGTQPSLLAGPGT